MTIDQSAASCPPQADDPILIDARRIETVAQRIRRKIEDYQAYDFSTKQSIALNVFFDLAQEFPDLEDLHAVFLLIPELFFDMECEAYVLDEDKKAIRRCAYRCLNSSPVEEFPSAPEIRDGCYLIPIKGNAELISQLPFKPLGNVIGLLSLAPAENLADHDKLFFERYANRFGYQFHNRLISQKNIEHVQFIRSLVKDIGHNVIVPNIYFKLFYKQLSSRIDRLEAFKEKLQATLNQCMADGSNVTNELVKDLEYIHASLKAQYHDIYAHYAQTSLFLETLLRRSHFEKGRYVLEKRLCNFKKQIIDPLVERYRQRFEDRGVAIDVSLGGIPDAEIEAVVDVGLISQVFANLFSNAVKYARETPSQYGRGRKFMAYGWRLERDFFGPGRDGLKLNVFSSGPPLSRETIDHIFDEGVRGHNADGEYGTGHGLYFVREVVRLHGGVSGCEATSDGNNFFFILPLEAEPGPDDGRRP